MASIATEAQYEVYAARWGLDPGPVDLAGALEGATAQVQEECGREFLPSPATEGETETRTVWGDGGMTLFVPDLIAAPVVSCRGGAVVGFTAEADRRGPITRLVIDPATAVLYSSVARWAPGIPYTITGRFGYAEQADLPEPVIRAVCMLAALEVNSAGDWGSALSGVKSEAVLDVKIEYAPNASGGLRQSALDVLRPYKRLF